MQGRNPQKVAEKSLVFFCLIYLLFVVAVLACLFVCCILISVHTHTHTHTLGVCPRFCQVSNGSLKQNVEPVNVPFV